jgi:DNA-binding response OmpR family regulator
VLRRSEGQTGSRREMRGGDVRVELDARRMHRSGRKVQLSQEEFELLAQGAILSRDLILTCEWGYDFYGDNARTIDVHIRWLCEKAEERASLRALLPERPLTAGRHRAGAGYRQAYCTGARRADLG